ncbi:uncharacterized protein LOC133187409 isoform X2 [Saccostrea echinata]|uniref:uncharacterized protein LOC133187409 isoform X2 n=1 Tax=Saccostrea echinata TaxID=191078 RepID=UPI002A834935|nr:uncharacterized protein LOC133187409 isoform X2 [Saccostrea echinata]
MDFKKWFCTSMFIVFQIINTATAYLGTISLNEVTCHNVQNIYPVSGDVAFNIDWSGEKITRDCKIIFQPSPENQKTCIEVVSYQIRNCDVQLTYSTYSKGENSDTVSYSCKASPTQFCGDSKNVAVQLTLKNPSNLINNSFRLKTTTTKSSTLSKSSTMTAVGVGIGVAVFMVIILFLVYRRRHAIALAIRSRTAGTRHLMTSDADDSHV